MVRSFSMRSCFLVLAVLGEFAGCSGPSVSVTPPHGPVLTCSTQMMSATVTGSSDQVVTWSISEDGSHGAIDMTSGLYTAPIAMPTPSTATVVATAHADSSAKGSSLLTIGTAFPSAARPVTGSAGYSSFDTGIFAHTVVARGTRMYATWPDNPTGGTTVGLKVARSDDGGATWMAPVTAFSVPLQSGKLSPSDAFIRCPGLAIDAANPDVVYAIGAASGPTVSPVSTDALDSDNVQFLGVSTDGGATWTAHVLQAGGGPICADVASPAADTVVVIGPGWECYPNGGRDIFVWSDANRGAGFASGATLNSPGEYFSAGYTGGLDDLNNDPACTAAHLVPESNGGTDSAGDATESPRLFTDGAGHLCTSYIGDVNHSNGTMDVNVYVQCSADAGKTWTAPVNVDTAAAPKVSTSAIGAIGPNGVITVIWADGKPGGLYTSTSTDGGKTFSAPSQTPHPVEFSGDTERTVALNPMIAYDAAGILWVGYRADDGNLGQITVDKSCDGGMTWSGPRGVETPSPGPTRYPQFALTPGAAPTLATWAEDHIGTYTLIPPAN
jgi:hypothetical protein